MPTIVRNTCPTSGGAPDERAFEITTTPNQTQKRALELIAQIKPVTERGAKISAGFIGETRLFWKSNQPDTGAGPGCRQALNCLPFWSLALMEPALTAIKVDGF